MRYGKTKVFGGVVVCMLLVFGMAAVASAKIPEGFRDIKLGMQKSQVLDLLKKSPRHFSYDELGGQIGEIIRGDDLFRYATYRFDDKGVLVEIRLHMREILGKERVLEVFNAQHDLKLGSVPKAVESGVSIEVQDNSLVMRMVPNRETHASKGKPQ